MLFTGLSRVFDCEYFKGSSGCYRKLNEQRPQEAILKKKTKVHVGTIKLTPEIHHFPILFDGLELARNRGSYRKRKISP